MLFRSLVSYCAYINSVRDKLTDDCTAYITSVALHPRYKWKYIKDKWAGKQEWINTVKKYIKGQWATYKNIKLPINKEAQLAKR